MWEPEIKFNEETIKVTYANSREPYEVKGSVSVPTLREGVLSFASAWLNKLWIHHQDWKDVVGRGNDKAEAELSIPLLEEEDTKLLAGKRELYLGWVGNKPPFQVYLNGQPWQNKDKLTETFIIFAQHNFKKDERYKVVITDAQSSKMAFCISN